MTYTEITPVNTTISAIDMRGNAVAPFVPFSVRGPQFIELKDKTILYFFDAKYNSQADEEPSCKVMLRSHDGGETWGEARVLTYKGIDFSINGLPIYDEIHDTLVYLGRSRHWKPEFEKDRLVTEHDQTLGHVDERFWAAKSTDGGLSWTDYKEVFVEAPASWSVQHCPSPLSGIQLKKQKDPSKNGRLIAPANQIIRKEDGKNGFGCHLLVSDDFGDTWHMGAEQNYEGGNECTAVELQDGTLILNSRTHGAIPANIRLQSFSYDGGDTFAENGPVETLFDPCCSAGFTNAVVDGQEYIFFTVPSGELDEPWEFLGPTMRWGKREALMLHMSADGGRTYKPIKQLSPKGEFAGYSALIATSGGKLLCAWEADPGKWEDQYRVIKYAVLDLEELVKGITN